MRTPRMTQRARREFPPSLPWGIFLRALRGQVVSEVTPTEPVRGLDLAKYHVDVRKLYYSTKWPKILVGLGIDPEEGLSDVYRGILTRNQGRSPFTPDRGSLGHYVHVVTNSVILNLLRKFNRDKPFSVLSAEGDLPEDPDHSAGDLTEDYLTEELLSRVASKDREEARELLELLSAGNPRSQAVKFLGKTQAWGEQLVAQIREAYHSQ